MKALALFVAVVGGFTSIALAADGPSPDLAKMSGVWQVSYSIEPGGERTGLKTVTIENGALMMNGRKFFITLSPQANPPQIDLKDADAAYMVYRGIYELDNNDDQLRISFAHWDRAADSPNARPRTFNAENADFFHLKLLKMP